MGLITFFISIPILVLYKWKAYLNVKNVSIGVICGIAIALAVIALLPGSFNRLRSLSAVSSANIDRTSAESTTVRILIWQQATAIIKKNFLLGTGVGDANDELYNAYEKNGLTGALEHKLNAHNQYLQTFIGMGLFGLSILLLFTVGALITAIRRMHFFLLLFSLLIVLNFTVESMLQTSAGVLFFAFFYCFFYLADEERLKDEVTAALE